MIACIIYLIIGRDDASIPNWIAFTLLGIIVGAYEQFIKRDDME